MSCLDGFIYNFLTMGVIFPWVYVYGPAVLPNANLKFAIVLTLLAQLPISLSYSILATVLPVSGGDYIYQTRAFGKLGFISVMSGFVLWVLAWIPISGWLFIKLGVAPLLFSLGSPRFAKCGALLQEHSSFVIFCASLFLAAAAILILLRGLRLFALVQRVLFGLTIASVLTILYVFQAHAGTFDQDINSFVHSLLPYSGVPPGEVDAAMGQKDFTSLLTTTFENPAPVFTILATLGAVPLAWTSLQWATYSVQQNTEISGADRFSRQVFMLVLSAILVAGFLVLIAHFETAAARSTFITAASRAYCPPPGMELTPRQEIEHKIVSAILPPFPNVLAMSLTRNTLLRVIIALGFMANAFQVTCNCFIGMTRIMMAMSIDGMLPAGLMMRKAGAGRPSALRAHGIYFLASIPFTAIYSFVEPSQNIVTVAVTIACGYVFVLTALSATRIPTNRMRNFWVCSSIYRMPKRLIVWSGYLGGLAGAAMLCDYVWVQPFVSPAAMGGIVGLLIILAYLIYLCSRDRTPTMRDKLQDVPREVHDFSMGDRK
jgi:amino acid transporter